MIVTHRAPIPPSLGRPVLTENTEGRMKITCRSDARCHKRTELCAFKSQQMARWCRATWQAGLSPASSSCFLPFPAMILPTFSQKGLFLSSPSRESKSGDLSPTIAVAVCYHRGTSCVIPVGGLYDLLIHVTSHASARSHLKGFNISL